MFECGGSAHEDAAASRGSVFHEAQRRLWTEARRRRCSGGRCVLSAGAAALSLGGGSDLMDLAGQHENRAEALLA
ncbi:hypothetical protein, partial [Brevundimonas sp.]|uniref:hypothetical protein n=1 Tax=Brevundimonas sp. TaxID=1871086 RepID=UPI0025C05607